MVWPESAGATAKAPANSSADQRLTTVALADHDEYLRFTAAVFEAFGGDGLELTNAPVPCSVRLRGWLLDWAEARFALRVLAR